MIPEQEAVERMFSRQSLRSAVRDWLITAGLLLLGYVLSNLLPLADPGGGFVSMLFVLMVAITARLTAGEIDELYLEIQTLTGYLRRTLAEVKNG